MNDWRVLSRCDLLSYDSTSLRKFFYRVGDPASTLLESPLATGFPFPAYSAEAIRLLFDLDGQDHCFSEKPHAWARFHEPQITKGLVHYLSAGSFDQQRARALAFYRAACRCAKGSFPKLVESDVFDVEVVAEESINATTRKRGLRRVARGRIDLLINFELEGGEFTGVALEAKFDHSLTPGQLKKYSAHLQNERKWTLETAPLVLVGRSASDISDCEHWHAATWWKMMREFEREIKPADDVAFRQFRRTIWETAYA